MKNVSMKNVKLKSKYAFFRIFMNSNIETCNPKFLNYIIFNNQNLIFIILN